jgi:hypothetical protein
MTSARKMHTAEPSVREPTYFEDDITTEIAERYKSIDIGKIATELVQAGRETLRSTNNSAWSKEEATQQWNESITVIIIEGYHIHIKLYPIFFSQGQLHV